MKAIVTVIGEDKIGIIAGVSAVLAGYRANILDISQTVMQDTFVMVMLVDLTAVEVPFAELSEALDEKGREMAMSIRIQRQDIFETMHRV
ncbi:MAG: ACT domain-containing protein [Christensenellales bacterium]|jgi:ACT domain-containing protein